MSLTFLVDLALKGTALLVVLFAIVSLLRGTAAATRHVVWSVGLTALVLLPLVAAIVPWRIELLPLDSGEVATPAATDARRSLSAPMREVSQPQARTGVNDGAPHVVPTTAAPGRPNLALAHETRARAWAAPSAATLWSAAAVLWLAGLAAIAFRLLIGVWAVRGIARHGSNAGSEWEHAARAARVRLGLAQTVRLVASDRVRLPYTAGCFHPVVVVPASAKAWSDDRRLAVLLHEFAHLRRGDFLPHLVAQAACAMHWFNPLVWIAARRLRAESERACDDLVLTSGERASDYAGHLLEVVRAAGRARTPAHALPMAQRSEFEGRVLAILDAGVKRHAASPFTGAVAAAVITVLALPLAAMGPARDSEGPGTAVDSAATLPPPSVQRPETPTSELEPAASDDAGMREAIVSTPTPSVEPSAGAAALPTLRRSPMRQHARTGQAQDAPPGATGALIVALRDPVAAVRQEAAHALGALEDTTAMRALMRALREDTDAEVRRSAAWALGEMEDARAIPALAAAVAEDRDERVRAMAAWALGEIEDARAVEGLGVALRDRSAAVREAAIHALGEIEDPRAIEPLTLALRDSSVEIRSQAAWALGEIEDARAVPALSTALSDRDAKVRRMAAWALGEIESPTAVDALGAALRDADLEVRRAALYALGEIEHGSAVPHIIPLLRDADAEVRQRAAWALGEIEDRRAVEPLMAAVTDANGKVREYVVWALGEIEDPRTQTALATALKDEMVSVRRKAAWALGELEIHQAPPELIAALRDADTEVRRAAAHALGEIGDPAGVLGLKQLLSDADGQTKRMAVWALAEIHDPAAYEALVAALQDPDPEIRRLAARALGRR